jgi:mannose/fructose/N-acetylgalactosamine-specific phosphotransferase system component IIC
LTSSPRAATVAVPIAANTQTLNCIHREMVIAVSCPM